MFTPTDIKRQQTLPTGFLWVDYLLEGKGLNRGCLYELIGPPAVGKSSFALQLAGQIQRYGGVVVYVDADGSFSPSYARRLGVQTDELFVLHPDHINQLVEMLHSLHKTLVPDLIILDSLPALSGQLESEQTAHPDGTLRYYDDLDRLLRYLTGLAELHDSVVVAVNQYRQVQDEEGEWTEVPACRRLHQSADIFLRFAFKPNSFAADEGGIEISIHEGYTDTIPKRMRAILDPTFGISPYAEAFLLGVYLRLIQFRENGFCYHAICMGETFEAALAYLRRAPQHFYALRQEIWEGLPKKIRQ